MCVLYRLDRFMRSGVEHECAIPPLNCLSIIWTCACIDCRSFAYFLDRGYAVVSTQYSLVCYGYSALDMQADLTTAFEYVRANATGWGLDGDNIHIVGGSAGGHLALLTAYSLNSSAVRSVFNTYGISDISRMPDAPSCTDMGTSGAGNGLLFTLASRSCSQAAMAAISPLNLVSAH